MSCSPHPSTPVRGALSLKPTPVPLSPRRRQQQQQQPFVDNINIDHHREHLEFIRRSEWTSRIAHWAHQSAGTDTKSLANSQATWSHILAALEQLQLDDAPLPEPRSHPAPAAGDDDEDDEPYVIYTASPRSAASPLRADNHSPIPPAVHTASPPALSPSPGPRRRRSRLDSGSRHSSLSSIYEEDEPAPCP